MTLLRSRTAALALSSFALVGACAASESTSASPVDAPTGTGTAADGGAGDTAPAPHALCASNATSDKEFPDDVGKSCGAGSNKSLCAVSGPSCSSGHCLWDDTDPNASFGRAYCTVACNPADADACPAGFACKAQGCSDGPAHVCVGKAPATTADCEDVSSALAGRSIRIMDIVASDGTIYVTASATEPSALVVLARAKGASAWTKLHEQAWSNALSPATAIAQRDVVLLNLGARRAGILRGTSFDVADLAPCEGDPNKCQSEISMLFVTGKGAPHAITRNVSGDQWLVPLAKGKLPEGAPVEQRISQLLPLPEGGALAGCRAPGSDSVDSEERKLCTLDDGGLVPLALPPGESLPTSLIAAGDALDDFYLLTASGSVYHRVGEQWLKEGLSGSPAAEGRFQNGSAARAADGTIFFRLDGTPGDDGAAKVDVYGLVGGCWKALPSETATSGAPLEGLTFLSAGTAEVCRWEVSL